MRGSTPFSIYLWIFRGFFKWDFSVYALKIGIDVKDVSVILPAFALGSIVFQLPLGIISDRLGRRKILVISMIFGVVFFYISRHYSTFYDWFIFLLFYSWDVCWFCLFPRCFLYDRSCFKRSSSCRKYPMQSSLFNRKYWRAIP